MTLPLGLTYDALYNSWVLELAPTVIASARNSTSSSKSENPSDDSSNNVSTVIDFCNDVSPASCSTPTSYESCTHNGDESRLSSPSWSPEGSQASPHLPTSEQTQWSSSSSSPVRNYVVELVTFTHRGHGKLWHMVKAGCMACFKPIGKRNKKAKNDDRSSNYYCSPDGPFHMRNASTERREQIVKEAILYCKMTLAR